MFRIYIPFSYLIHSRLKKTFDLLSWQIIFIIPQFAITYFYLYIRSDLFVLIFFITQIIFHTLYEIGYLENDIITTEKEKKPTNRLSKKNKTYIKNNYSKIINFRYLIIFCFLGILYWLDSFSAYRLNILTFIALLVFNRIVFFIHNNVRSKLNILTFFILSVTKFVFPIVLFIRFEIMLYPIFLMILIFPLLRTIEISTLKRHNLKKIAKIINDIDRFRIFYYSLNSLIVIMLWYLSFLSDQNFILTIIVLVYFLLFRISTYLLIKEGVYKRDTAVETNVNHKSK